MAIGMGLRFFKPTARTPDAHFMTEVRYKGTKSVQTSLLSSYWRYLV